MLKHLRGGASPLGAHRSTHPSALEDALPGDPTTDLPPSQHTRNGKDDFPGWEEEETAAERGITQSTLSYRNTPRPVLPLSQAAMPLFRAAQSCNRKKNLQSHLCTQNDGKGDEPPVPKRQSGRNERSPGGEGGSTPLPLCLPIPREPQPPRRHGAVCWGSPGSRAGQTQR